MEHDSHMLVRSELLALIGALEPQMVHFHPVRFLMQLDQIRRTAVQHGLDGVPSLISALETAISRLSDNAGGVLVVQNYVEAMHEALECDSLNPAMTEALMAHVALRMGGQT
jgi:hypothetical protein